MKTRKAIMILLVLLLSTVAVYGTTKSKSPFTGSTYTHNSMFDNYEKYDGLDISQWQGDINWNKLSNTNKVDFVIVRCAYRTTKYGKVYTDVWYEDNLKGAASHNIPAGVYIFSQAINKTEAREEADYLLDCIKGYDIDLPVILDFEFGHNYRINALKKKSKSYNTEVVSAFCKKIKDAGYTPMVYANYSEMNGYLEPGTLLDRGYQLWLAHWASKSDMKYKYLCWQYSSSGSVAGISGNVDSNFFYDNGEFVVNKIKGLKRSARTNDSITITWNKKQAASSYRIYRSDRYGGKYSKIAETDTNKYKDEGLESGKEYYYRVAAYYKDTGELSKKSEKLSASTSTDTSRIGKVTGNVNLRTHAATSYKKIRTMKTGNVVSVIGETVDASGNTWYRIRYINGKTNVSGYVKGSYLKVYKVRTTASKCSLCSDSSTDSTVIGTVQKGKSFKIEKTVTSGSDVWYRCKVYVDGKKISGWINRADTKKYGNYSRIGKTSKVLRTAKTDDSITLKWNKVDTAEKYRIYRSRAYNGKYKLIGTSTSNRFTDSGRKKGYTYYYKVSAGNIFEFGSKSKVAVMSTTAVKATGTTAKKLKLRTHAGTSFSVKTTVPEGAEVTISYTTYDKSGRKWYRVTYKKKKGYLLAKYVSKRQTAKAASQAVEKGATVTEVDETPVDISDEEEITTEDEKTFDSE